MSQDEVCIVTIPEPSSKTPMGFHSLRAEFPFNAASGRRRPPCLERRFPISLHASATCSRDPTDISASPSLVIYVASYLPTTQPDHVHHRRTRRSPTWTQQSGHPSRIKGAHSLPAHTGSAACGNERTSGRPAGEQERYHAHMKPRSPPKACSN